MPLNAGQLSHQVALSHRMLTRNDQGEQVATWPSPYAITWAEKRDLRGQRRFQAAEFVSEQVSEFTLRWRDDLVLTDHLTVLDNGVVYEILQSSEIGRNEGLDLLCRAIVP